MAVSTISSWQEFGDISTGGTAFVGGDAFQWLLVVPAVGWDCVTVRERDCVTQWLNQCSLLTPDDCDTRLLYIKYLIFIKCRLWHRARIYYNPILSNEIVSCNHCRQSDISKIDYVRAKLLGNDCAIARLSYGVVTEFLWVTAPSWVLSMGGSTRRTLHVWVNAVCHA